MKQGNNMELYINGDLVSRENLKSSSQANNGPFYFGAAGRSAGFGGGMDNIQVHKRALNSAEIAKISMGYILRNSDLVLAFDFEGGVVNGKVKDISGHNNDGRVNGGWKILQRDSLSENLA